MTYDRNGRRVEYVEMNSNSVSNVCATNLHQRFVYDGYLCLQRLDAAANNAVTDLFEWDPTELVATRPLYWLRREPSGNYSLFYTHDGNKNVSEVVFYQRARGVAAHYEYAPYGALTATTSNTAFTTFNVAEVNSYRFSSEYAEDVLGLMYYNFRFYDSELCNWLNRDLLDENGGINLYLFCANNSICCVDILGFARALTGSLIPDYSRWSSGHKASRDALRYLHDTIESIEDCNHRRCYEVVFKDLVIASEDELNDDLRNHGSNLFLMGHGALLVNGKRWGQEHGKYERKHGDEVKSLLARHANDHSPFVLEDLCDNLEFPNVFGCYLSNHVREYDSHGRLLRAMYDDWETIYKEFQRRLKDKYETNPQKCCPHPTKIIIYEGEWKSLSTNKGYPTKHSQRFYPPKQESYYEEISRKYWTSAQGD